LCILNKSRQGGRNSPFSTNLHFFGFRFCAASQDNFPDISISETFPALDIGICWKIIALDIVFSAQNQRRDRACPAAMFF